MWEGRGKDDEYVAAGRGTGKKARERMGVILYKYLRTVVTRPREGEEDIVCNDEGDVVPCGDGKVLGVQCATLEGCEQQGFPSPEIG